VPWVVWFNRRKHESGKHAAVEKVSSDLHSTYRSRERDRRIDALSGRMYKREYLKNTRKIPRHRRDRVSARRRERRAGGGGFIRSQTTISRNQKTTEGGGSLHSVSTKDRLPRSRHENSEQKRPEVAYCRGFRLNLQRP